MTNRGTSCAVLADEIGKRLQRALAKVVRETGK